MRLRLYFPVPLAAAILLALGGQIAATPPESSTELRFLPANQPFEAPPVMAIASVAVEVADSESVMDDEVGEVYEPAERFEDFVGPETDDPFPHLVFEEVFYSPQTAVRFGWWGVNTSGSKTKIGEWQGLDSSSPFWDVDGIRSDGSRTFDFFATGTENETTQVGMHFYNGPRLTADLDYDRFLHRLDHKRLNLPFGGFSPDLPSAGTAPRYWAEDLDPGADHAMRVQQLRANFKGDLTKNIRWRLNVWGMQKEGTRQALSAQHCFRPPPPVSSDPSTCHVVSQSQSIDWLTMEIEPVIEARFGWLTVEYSRTMRSFQQNDELVVRPFTSTSSAFNLGPAGASNFVPENITEIDRVKLSGRFAPDTSLYVLGHVGNTQNQFREANRKFYGVDARVTNTTLPGLSVTGYGKTFTENHSPDTVALNVRYPGQADLWLEPNAPQANPFYLDLVDRDRATVGVKSRWRPFYDDYGLRRGLALTGGYEYSHLERRNATYNLMRLTPSTVFTQGTTVTNMFFVGAQQDWSRSFDTFVRYRMIGRSNPLVGLGSFQARDLEAAINTNQPEHEDRIEIGGTWNPTHNFMVNASFWLETTRNHSDYVTFDEDNYPIVVSTWWAPDERWSFSGGFATFSNWITQDITLGTDAAGPVPAFTAPWSYSGRADVLNLGGTFAYSPRLTLISGFEFVHSYNAFAEPPAPETALPAGVDTYSDLPGYSQVRVNTYRLTAGSDYRLSKNINSFVRYNYFDYDDRGSTPFNSGTAHMFLTGLSGVY